MALIRSSGLAIPSSYKSIWSRVDFCGDYVAATSAKMMFDSACSRVIYSALHIKRMRKLSGNKRLSRLISVVCRVACTFFAVGEGCGVVFLNAVSGALEGPRA